ncbi:hypothetical protein niasHT_002869 [Heterodera trifolii]|uniref:Uncharacterized protein n=1 Tax=Heterodera trifolii TaxID=157864 RepID=A0ABD2LPY1_9BILA
MVAPEWKLYPDMTPDGLHNFEKRRKEFEVLAEIRLFQSAARSYTIQLDQAFCVWFHFLPALNEKECASGGVPHQSSPSPLSPSASVSSAPGAVEADERYARAQERAQMFGTGTENVPQIVEQLTLWYALFFRDFAHTNANSIALHWSLFVCHHRIRPQPTDENSKSNNSSRGFNLGTTAQNGCRELRALRNFSALQSEPVFRLKQCWALVSKVGIALHLRAGQCGRRWWRQAKGTAHFGDGGHRQSVDGGGGAKFGGGGLMNGGDGREVMEKGNVLDDPVELSRLLRQAERDHLRAAEQMRTLRKIVEKNAAAEKGVWFRDDKAAANSVSTYMSDLISNRGGGCLCNGTSIFIQEGLRNSFIGGSLGIKVMCNTLMESPLTPAECTSMVETIFQGAISISMELTSEDVLCNLVDKNCTEKTYNKTGPISCEYCKIMHAKAKKVAEHVDGMFLSLNVMCARLDTPEVKDHCEDHVFVITNNIKQTIKLYLDEKVAKKRCKYTFMCKK